MHNKRTAKANHKPETKKLMGQMCVDHSSSHGMKVFREFMRRPLALTLPTPNEIPPGELALRCKFYTDPTCHHKISRCTRTHPRSGSNGRRRAAQIPYNPHPMLLVDGRDLHFGAPEQLALTTH